MPLGPAGVTILCDTSTGRPRPWIPASCRRKIFDIINGVPHPSGRTTARFLSEKFIREWAKTCINCHTSKIKHHTESGIGEFPQQKRRFGHIHIDVLGPLLPSGSTRYLLTIIDCSTSGLEASLMTEATTQVWAEALLSSWVSRFGVHDGITMDRSPAFLSEIWLALVNLM
ncbi:uncharacterized protein [Palaemon carinicauda]|uniref:uncharacterized protein n=1 Tax=Palaemon carinicauda TaxID=392227 RepID=UPI0035B603E4